jgi:hypothetical protein
MLLSYADSIQEEEPQESFQQRQMQLRSCLKKRAPKADLENQNILKGLLFHWV